jgi:hypothetical protein
LLTGIELEAGELFAAGMGGPGSGWPTGISIDQFIAQKLPKRQHFSIDFAIKRMAGSIWSRMSYTGPKGQVVEPFDDPSVAFDTLFKDVGADAAAIARQTSRRKSVLDNVTGELQALSGSLSGADKVKVQAHLTRLREIEMQLDVPGGVVTGCVKPARPMLTASAPIIFNSSGMEVKQDPSADADVPTRHDLARKMLVSAMACDMARVGTIMMAPSRSDIFFTWLPGQVKSHHDYSHDGDTMVDSQQKLVAINQWYAKQVAEMITLLKGVPEGQGTMFDNTVLLWANELGIGNSHSHTKIPLMLAGSGGGYFKTGGLAVQMPNGTPHNRLFLSICEAMGITGVTAFGNPKFCAAGPIAEIKA